MTLRQISSLFPILLPARLLPAGLLLRPHGA